MCLEAAAVFLTGTRIDAALGLARDVEGTGWPVIATPSFTTSVYSLQPGLFVFFALVPAFCLAFGDAKT